MQKHYFISGKVQGVGYRFFTQVSAQSLNLSGWVRNLPDGRVEAVAVGNESQLTEFKKKLQEGPPLSKVWSVSENEEPEQQFSGFEFRR